MPQRDLYHDIVVEALTADDWTITHDPLTLAYGGRNLFVDLGAKCPIGAEKDGRKIAVEIKSFLGASDIQELEIALGQYNLYRDLLAELEPERTLYLAIPNYSYMTIFSDPLGELIMARQRLNLIVFDDERMRIVKWIP